MLLLAGGLSYPTALPSLEVAAEAARLPASVVQVEVCCSCLLLMLLHAPGLPGAPRLAAGRRCRPVLGGWRR